jgi:hypothetical protein
MFAKGRQHDRSGENHPRTPLKEIDVAHIRYFLKRGWSQGRLAERYGVARTSIQQIKEWRSWVHIQPFQPIDGEPLPVPPPLKLTAPALRRY